MTRTPAESNLHLQLRRLALCPLSHKGVAWRPVGWSRTTCLRLIRQRPYRVGTTGVADEPTVGLEPTTFRLRNGCATGRAAHNLRARATLPGSGNGESTWSLPWRAARPLCYNRVPVLGSNGEPPGLQPGALPLSLTGVPRTRVDLRGLEPRTSALPRRRAPDCATSPSVRGPRIELGMSCSQSRRVSQLPRPECSGGRRPPGGRPPTAGYMPSTVDLSKNDERKGGRIRTCNTRCWRPVLWPLSYTPWTATRNAAFP